MSKIVIIVRNKPRISLISLVFSTIISPISCKKGNYFWGCFFRRVVVFGEGGMATFRDLVTLVKFYRYFRRVVTFGIPCETSHVHDFISAKSHAREKPLLAEYSDQFGIACYVYHFPHFLQKKKLHFVLLRWRLS